MAGGKYRIELQVAEATSKLVKAIKSIKGVSNVESSDNRLLISCDKDLRPQIARAVVDSNALLVQMKIEEYGLDDVYLKYFRES